MAAVGEKRSPQLGRNRWPSTDVPTRRRSHHPMRMASAALARRRLFTRPLVPIGLEASRGAGHACSGPLCDADLERLWVSYTTPWVLVVGRVRWDDHSNDSRSESIEAARCRFMAKVAVRLGSTRKEPLCRIGSRRPGAARYGCQLGFDGCSGDQSRSKTLRKPPTKSANLKRNLRSPRTPTERRWVRCLPCIARVERTAVSRRRQPIRGPRAATPD